MGLLLSNVGKVYIHTDPQRVDQSWPISVNFDRKYNAPHRTALKMLFLQAFSSLYFTLLHFP